MMFVYFLLFAVVMVGTRLGVQYWRPLTDFSEAWSVGIFLAVVACMILSYYRGHRKSPIEEKLEPRFQDKPVRFQATSPYDGGIIVGGVAMAANTGVPGVVALQGDSGGGSSGYSSCGPGGDGGGDCGGGGGH